MQLISLPDIYGDEFFASIDGVTNALDNVKARTHRELLSCSQLMTSRARHVHGSTVCAVRETAAGVRHIGHQGQYPSCCATPHGIVQLVPRSPGKIYTLLHNQEFPQSNSALH